MKPTPTPSSGPVQKHSVQPSSPTPAPEAPAAKNDLVMLAPTPELNPRNRVAAEIAARANATANADASESVPEGDGETAHVASAPAAEPAPIESASTDEPATEPTETQGDTPQAPAAAAPTALSGIDPEQEYEFVVDGIKTKIKGTQVISRVQKGETADHRLELASHLLREAKSMAPQPAQPPQGALPQEPATPVLSEAELANRIQYGTPEQAAEAIKALRAQRPDTVTQQGLQTFMVQQLPRIVESQLAFREGLSLLQKEHADILKDDDLRQLFFSKENAARQAGDRRPHVELYKELADGLRKRFNLSAPAIAASSPSAPAPQTIAQKAAAKAAAPAAPRLASARIEGTTTTAKPKSREEIINEMRKARGQHALTTR